TVGGWLDLSGTNITSLPNGLTVGGSLDLSGTNITSLPNGLTVGGSLDLSNTKITSLPDNLTVDGLLDLNNTTITSLPDNLTVDGSLYLRNTKITSLPDNLTVGGSLYLRYTKITSLPDNLTVGGSLYLRYTQITSLPDDLLVGNMIYSDLGLQAKKIIHGTVTDKWVFADDILTHIKVVKKIGDMTVYVTPYKAVVVTKDGKTFAHGNTIREAVQDLRFKEAERNIDDYREFDRDSVLEFDDAVIMFRVITGACAYGTNRFIEEQKIEKRPYSVGEILELTKGQYGHEEFAKYFGGK
ncbi:MAG: hypothetical protein PHW40_05440, partial [Candidatus Izemoplasmatales bacterium]|nr:hypothetical protein [Candidatus Izemoplasmatales bacterium]